MMQKPRYVITLILGLLITQVAFAGPFTPNPTDKSLLYLGNIFGGSVGTITLSNTANPLVATLFEKLNYVVFTLGVLIISYVGFVSTINTAQEGETMGKKWSTIWLPLRSVLGMSLLAPVPGSGYSALQVTIMWLIVQGIGAANLIWDTVLVSLERGVAATGSINIQKAHLNQIEANISNLIQDILKARICVDGGKALKSEDISHSDYVDDKAFGVRPYVKVGNVITSNPQYITINSQLNFGIRNAKSPLNKVCGKFDLNESLTVPLNDAGEVDCENAENSSEYCKIKKAGQNPEDVIKNIALKKLEGINAAYAVLGSISRYALRFNDEDKFNNFLESYFSRNIFQAAKDAYINKMKELFVPDANTTGGDLRNVTQNARLNGWIHAGSYYFTMVKTRGDVGLYDAAKATPPYTPNTEPNSIDGELELESVDLPGYLENYLEENGEESSLIRKWLRFATLTLSKDMATPRDNSAFGSTTSDIPGTDGFAKIISDGIRDFIEQISGQKDDDAELGDVDPLVQLSQTGQVLMIIAEIVWIQVIRVSFGMQAAAGICAALNPGAYAGQAVLLTLVSIIIMAFVMMWAGGATLGIYLPMIPYLIYTISAIGWFMSVIEAIVAAPIVSLGFMAPSNEELGKIGPALMLITNIVLRPSLMVLSFIFAARLVGAAFLMINLSFLDTLLGNTYAFSSGLLAPLAVIVFYIYFVIAVANKSFTLIYAIPDRILVWIGGQAMQSDMSALQETKQGFETGTRNTQQTLEGATKQSLAEIKDNKNDGGGGKGSLLPKESSGGGGKPGAGGG